MTNRRFGGHIILTLTRWRSDKPPTAGNLVLIMQDQAEKLASLGSGKAFSPEVVKKIEQRLLWAEDIIQQEDKGNATFTMSRGNKFFASKFLRGFIVGSSSIIATYIIFRRSLINYF